MYFQCLVATICHYQINTFLFTARYLFFVLHLKTLHHKFVKCKSYIDRIYIHLQLPLLIQTILLSQFYCCQQTGLGLFHGNFTVITMIYHSNCSIFNYFCTIRNLHKKSRFGLIFGLISLKLPALWNHEFRI